MSGREGETRRWLRYAGEDLRVAHQLAASPEAFPRHSCFLAQQAAEKALKAALILAGIEIPFTHDLDKLRNLLPADWRTPTACPDLSALTIWAVEARYPGDLPEVVEADAWEALRNADAVYQAVKADLQAHGLGEQEPSAAD